MQQSQSHLVSQSEGMKSKLPYVLLLRPCTARLRCLFGEVGREGKKNSRQKYYRVVDERK